MGPVDAAMVLAFVVWAVVAGLRARRVSGTDLEQYFLAGRTLPGWKAGLSMAATQFAADTPLLVTGLVASAGIAALWRMWIYAIAFLLVGFVLGGPWRRAGVLTDAELAELRYGGRAALALRVIKAVYFGTVLNCTVLAMVLFAATRIAEPLLPWHEWLSPAAFEPVRALIEHSGWRLGSADTVIQTTDNVLSLAATLGLTAMYSTTGGLRAVVDTDVVQLVLALLATAIYAGYAIAAIGGLAALPTALIEAVGRVRAHALLSFTPHPRDAAELWLLAAIAVQWLAQANADGTGYLAQRQMACRSDRDAEAAAVVFVVVQILVRSLLWLPIAVALVVLVPGDPGDVASREQSFVTGFVALLPAGALGLMVVGMLAALASTVDTHLNWGASYWARDLYERVLCRAWRRREPSPRAQVWVARASSLVIAALALVVMTRLRSIQQAWTTTLLLGAGMGPPLLLRWLWWRPRARTELVALAVSLALAPVLVVSIDHEATAMLVMAMISLLTTVIAARLEPGAPEPSAIEFYRRVDPPGWWAPVARACGDAPRRASDRLRRGLARTALASASVFTALVGLGSLLIGAPPPAWLPWRWVWIGGCLVTALITAAAAWRLRRPP